MISIWFGVFTLTCKSTPPPFAYTNAMVPPPIFCKIHTDYSHMISAHAVSMYKTNQDPVKSNSLFMYSTISWSIRLVPALFLHMFCINSKQRIKLIHHDLWHFQHILEIPKPLDTTQAKMTKFLKKYKNWLVCDNRYTYRHGTKYILKFFQNCKKMKKLAMTGGLSETLGDYSPSSFHTLPFVLDAGRMRWGTHGTKDILKLFQNHKKLKKLAMTAGLSDTPGDYSP